MRNALLALMLFLGLTAPTLAQVPRVKIESVRVGFGNRGDGSGAKANAWAPVYIDLTAGLEPIGPHTGSIYIDVPDADGLMTTYTVPLPSLQAKETTSVPIIGYTRPGSTSEEVHVTVRTPDGRTLASTRGTRPSYGFRGPGSILYLIAGVRASAMLPAVLEKQKQPGVGPGMQPPPQPLPGADPDDVPFDVEDDLLYDDTRSFTFADSVVQLPPHWFGYSAVDLLVLKTGNDGFLNDLVADKSTRKTALAEWVRRGGRILISVGRNHQLVNQLLGELNLIGCTLDGTVQLKTLPAVQQWARDAKGPMEGPRLKGGAPGERGPVDLVKIVVQPNRGVETLLAERGGEGGEKPVVVQASYGLGRVVLVAFDLDTPPFTEWTGQKSFYKKLQSELEPKFVSTNVQMMPGGRQFNVGVDANDASAMLHQRLESFDEVPVISFGWVALFILLYILVVGPLDYFILKKVVKRLELTWITFPTVVLVVSAAAYFTAYYLKGNELRINKVDVVDIVAELDPETRVAHGVQATGTTWFTLFSPRIQSYTIGIEPSMGWASPRDAESESKDPYSTVVTWFGRPSDSFGNRAGTGGLFSRSYNYAPEAAGLFGAPIQVWATKSFTATWEAGLSKATPLIEAELAPSAANSRILSGSITNRLPVELTEVALLYRGYAYTLGQLPPNQPVRIEDKEVGIKARDSRAMDDWLRDVTWQPNLPVGPAPRQEFGAWQRQGQPVSYLIKPLLFGEAQREGTRNSTLRYLDQGWRLSRGGQASQRDEVILIGRPVTAPASSAEATTKDPSNPSQLWLGALPSAKSQRPSLSGVLSQETYVRVFLPVATKP